MSKVFYSLDTTDEKNQGEVKFNVARVPFQHASSIRVVDSLFWFFNQSPTILSSSDGQHQVAIWLSPTNTWNTNNKCGHKWTRWEVRDTSDSICLFMTEKLQVEDQHFQHFQPNMPIYRNHVTDEITLCATSLFHALLLQRLIRDFILHQRNTLNVHWSILARRLNREEREYKRLFRKGVSLSRLQDSIRYSGLPISFFLLEEF
jgi:hypothetical protein